MTFAGAPVAAICAETEAQLDDALAALKVEYEALPHVVDATEAQAEGAPSVNEGKPNAGEPGGGRRAGPVGDPEKAFAAAEAKVSAEYRTSIQTHSCLETHGSLAEFDAAGDLTIWSSTQGTMSVRNDAAQVGNLPVSKVRVITEFMGGGFGAKFGLDVCDRIAIQMAKATGRPVRYMNDRREEHLDGREPSRLGADADARRQARRHAHRPHGRSATAPRATVRAAPTRRTPGSTTSRTGRSTSSASRRTRRSGSAFRAPGHPQGIFALESLVDEFATAIGMDPLDVRRLNDKHPVRRLEWPIGAKRIGWAENRRKVPGSDKGPVKRGLGCAGGTWGNFGGGNWRIDVTVGRDGSVVVTSGVQDLGTGTKTVLAVLVAEELGIGIGDVTVAHRRHALPRRAPAAAAA